MISTGIKIEEAKGYVGNGGATSLFFIWNFL